MLNTLNNFVRRLRREEGLKEARETIARQQREIEQLRSHAPGLAVDPENFIWILGSGRTGSTWLARMMRDLGRHSLWNEPLVGLLFGQLFHERGEDWRQDTKHFILGGEKESWLPHVRRYILDSIAAKFPQLARSSPQYLVIKEPHGSLGAPLIMEALPESRMIFLVRDPRDAVASKLDRMPDGRIQKGEGRQMSGGKERLLPKRLAQAYQRDIESVSRAYEAHEGRKVLVRYEDLRADTLETMKRIYSELEIPVSEKELAGTVDKHAWENIPEEKKGEGKLRRKARPGGWEEDLTPDQVEEIEGQTAEILDRFYGGD